MECMPLLGMKCGMHWLHNDHLLKYDFLLLKGCFKQHLNICICCLFTTFQLKLVPWFSSIQVSQHYITDNTSLLSVMDKHKHFLQSSPSQGHQGFSKKLWSRLFRKVFGYFVRILLSLYKFVLFLNSHDAQIITATYDITLIIHDANDPYQIQFKAASIHCCTIFPVC